MSMIKTKKQKKQEALLKKILKKELFHEYRNPQNSLVPFVALQLVIYNIFENPLFVAVTGFSKSVLYTNNIPALFGSSKTDVF